MKKRILFCMEDLAMNGAAKSLVSLLDALKDEPYELSLFLFSQTGQLIKDVPPHVKVLPVIKEYETIRLPLKTSVLRNLCRGRLDLAWFRFRISLDRKHRRAFRFWDKLPEIKGDWDVVIAYADGFISQFVTRKVPRGKKVLWIHNDYTLYGQSKETYDAFRAADCAVSVSTDSISKFKQALGGEYTKPIMVVHNIIDAEKVKHLAECESAEKFNFVSVGRITRQKGFDLIPAIAEKLKAKGLDFTWAIIGGGNDWERALWQQDVDRRGVSKNITFLGELDNPMPYVKKADIVVIPSRFEGWGMTLSEALVLGKPVVATDIPVFHEQVTDGVNGYLRSFDADQFAAAILMLMNDAGLRKKFAAAAARYPFTRASVVQEFGGLIGGTTV